MADALLVAILGCIYAALLLAILAATWPERREVREMKPKPKVTPEEMDAAWVLLEAAVKVLGVALDLTDEEGIVQKHDQQAVDLAAVLALNAVNKLKPE